jgi:thiamine-monophosphate kinase
VGEVWLGDDAAVLAGGLLFATDAMVESVHFDLRFSTLFDAGWKALAVNCSDLAAMGGAPRAAVVAVVLPRGRPGVADAVAAGLLAAAESFGCPLVGGDTTVGDHLVLSVAVLGDAPPTGAVLRSGARPGDAVFVTGPLGGPRAALGRLRRGEEPPAESVERLHRPVPRLAEGRAAADAGSTAMIDISDGLSSDLGHICRQSGVGAVLEGAAIPLGAGASLDDVLAGGDDYELCFTAPDAARVAKVFSAAGLTEPARIGTVTRGGEIAVREADGRVRPVSPSGWEHPVP